MSDDPHNGLHGHWHSILTDLGFDGRTLSGRQVPCPVCGGKDRFRFDDKDDVGKWYCNKCGAGDGFRLLMLRDSIDFKEALAIARERMGVLGDIKPRAHNEPSVEDKRRWLNELWKGGKSDSDELRAYFQSRRIPFDRDPVLRWHPKATYRERNDDGTTTTTVAPAVLARYMRWTDDKPGIVWEPVTIQRIWRSLRKKAVMPPIRKMHGVFCPLGTPMGYSMQGDIPVLGVAEGIESALSVPELFGKTKINWPVWACFSTGQLLHFTPPRSTQQLHIYMDVDVSFDGQASAYGLARKLRTKRPDLKIEVHRPVVCDNVNVDYNDVLKRISP